MSPGAILAPKSLALADDGGDLKVSAIPHAAIAELCVKALDYPNAARTTPRAARTSTPRRASRRVDYLGARRGNAVTHVKHPLDARRLCAMTVPEGEGAASYDDLLPAVKADRRAFRDDLLQEHFLAVRVGGAALIAGLSAFAFTAFTVLKAIVGFGVGLLQRGM